ncbi:MAG: hypothetical protein J0I34_26630 [Pseudonocardia sp.]|uniref:hypothetical protein n=1 Tax=unclassified Pseudonocardia TaxID=2619320 RepID=UPI001AD419EB|nr:MULTISPECIES: hypothetical protein [unclassified Pseudonocardia]MBN9112349.1 hypothetical protein [Pseudonocardia sp.]
MWEDVAIALACIGFTVAVALVAIELGVIGRTTPLVFPADVRRHAADRASRPHDHARS